MAFINWNDKLSVQVAAMDQQHQQLVGLVNKLHDVMMSGRTRDHVGPILTELVSYTKKHFVAEEGFMLAIKYPGYDAHKKLHDDLTKKVVEFQQRLEKGELVTPNTLLNFLHLWLVNHIQEEDSAYGKFATKNQSAVKV
ncbi:MAG: bacteriohemerythrin [bacterium]|nr:bacteriohemerythrin [bacterium]